MTPEEILYKYWKYNEFRPLQLEIIESVLNKKDTLALMPTGGGKSICFQVPALIFEGITLVVSPLISLMKDQVSRLISLGIQAEAIVSTMSYKDIDRVKSNCLTGRIKLLYVSPERLQSESFKTFLLQLNISFLVVDEAHCISQWGYDFRPSYLAIKEVKTCFPKIPTLALTASATPEVVNDIMEKLEMKNTEVFKKSFVRSNLVYVIRKSIDKRLDLLEILKKIKGTAIIYVRTRRMSSDVASFLKQNGLNAEAYHAGLKFQVLQEVQEKWMKGKIRILSATTAFGMGIDKSDVRLVVHLDLPPSLEEYYQEAGRAGRDGAKAYAVTLYDENDKDRIFEQIQESYPVEETIQYVYEALVQFYQIATGVQNYENYSFDIIEFSKRAQLSVIQVRYALKELERQGYLFMSEGFYLPSKVMINYTKKELYDFQLRFPQFDTLIETLLRMYGGIMDMPVTIYEKMLATKLKTTVAEIQNGLEALNKSGVLDYYPQIDTPMISFGDFRYQADDVRIDMSLQQFLKERSLQKVNEMLRYIDDLYCRNVRLANYFGEELKNVCGFCDLCLNRKKSYVADEGKNAFIQYVLDFASLPDNSIKSMQLDKIFLRNKVQIQQAIQFLSDEGRIRIDDLKIELVDG